AAGWRVASACGVRRAACSVQRPTCPPPTHARTPARPHAHTPTRPHAARRTPHVDRRPPRRSLASGPLAPFPPTRTALPMRVTTMLLLLTLTACAGGGETSDAEGQEAAEAASPERAAVRPGLDVLLDSVPESLRGKRVGLITNHTGRDAAGRST